MCSISTTRIRIRKWINRPYRIHTSISLIVDEAGSFAETVVLRVYITSIAVIATEILALKCSGLKYKVT